MQTLLTGRKYVAKLLRDACVGSVLSLADLHSMRASATKPSLFGEIKVDYTKAITLADAGRAELRAIEEALSRILPHSRAPSRGSRSVSLHSYHS